MVQTVLRGSAAAGSSGWRARKQRVGIAGCDWRAHGGQAVGSALALARTCLLAPWHARAESGESTDRRLA